jgi:hypothetical protein
MKKIFAAIVPIALGSPAQALATEYQPGELYLIPRNVPMCETNEGEDCTEDKTRTYVIRLWSANNGWCLTIRWSSPNMALGPSRKRARLEKIR